LNKGNPRVNFLQFLDLAEHRLNFNVVPIPVPVALLQQDVDSVTDFRSEGLRDNNHDLMRVLEFSGLDLTIAQSVLSVCRRLFAARFEISARSSSHCTCKIKIGG